MDQHLKKAYSTRRLAEEADFCKKWVEYRHQRVLQFIYGVGCCTHVISYILSVLYIPARHQLEFTLVHGVALALLIIGVLVRKHVRLWYLSMGTSMVYLMAGYVYIISETSHWIFSKSGFGIACTVLMALTGPVILYFPARNWFVSLIATLLVVCAGWVARDAEFSGLFDAVYACYMLYCIASRYAFDLQLTAQAKSEYRFRRLVAPAQIIRQSISETANIESMFVPVYKQCICICSDWRNFQDLTSQMPGAELAQAIGDYYDSLQEILSRMLPDGNYFSDWIADEMFIVIFESSLNPAVPLADLAVNFAQAMLVEKAEFKRQRGIPDAIDIGIAGGEALIGLIGPADHRKATAIGNTPGRARRLEGVGKSLRRIYGNTDRIIFGEECKAALSQPVAVVPWVVPSSETLRNINDKELFYIEAAAPDAQKKLA